MHRDSGQSVCKEGAKVIFDPKQVYDFKLEQTTDEKILLKAAENSTGRGYTETQSWKWM